MLSSGFANSPLTKYGLVFVVTSSIAVSIADIKYLFYIQVVPHLWRYRQIWRLVAWQTCYSNSTEVLFASMLLYHLRIIERLWGPRKFASFLLATLAYTTLLPPLLLALFLRPLSLNTLNYLPSGPTAILFALLAQYHATVPYTYKYRISSTGTGGSSSNQESSSEPHSSQTNSSSSVLLSDKSPTYLLAAQVAFSQFPYTLLPAAVGWVVGYAWRRELLPGRVTSWRLPWWALWYVSDEERRRAQQQQQRQREADERESREIFPTDSSGGGFMSLTSLWSRSSGRRDTQRYEGLRRRLEGESRAVAAAATTPGDLGIVEQSTNAVPIGGEGRRASSGSGGVGGGGEQEHRLLAGQILDRFRGAF